MTQEQQDLLTTYREAVKVQKNYITKLEHQLEKQQLQYKEIIFDARKKYEALIDDLARKNEDLQKMVIKLN